MKKVNPHIIQWAIDWNGLTIGELEKAFPKIRQWLDGSHEPTFKQLEKLAAKTHTLVPYFTMQAIPDVSLQIADFRKANPGDATAPSPELFDTIDELLFKQAWLRDYFVEVGADKLEWVGAFAHQAAMPDVDAIADYLHELLDLEEGWASQSGISSTDEAWRTLRQAIEKQRVAVCISGYAGTNTRRTLKVSEFRGFALSDEYAPFIFVNGADAKTAQLFTLVHEMAHILFFQTGVSRPIEPHKPFGGEDETERFCDQISAEFLLPRSPFLGIWADTKDKEAALKQSTKEFKVSTIVVLRRALDLQLLTKQEFGILYDRHCKDRDLIKADKPSGGDYYRSQGTKLGTVLTDAIYTALKTGYLQFADAYKMTGFKSQNLDRFYRERGMVL
ncbi:MAG: ImmA/IrrE family metallo-endopeptidase [Coriobacteriaceae bacterium]|nr:ImmA/IrrE family metallo-endopeptidase [Coriobacteriaceae bacterium]